jgi:hypothetical protein
MNSPRIFLILPLAMLAACLIAPAPVNAAPAITVSGTWIATVTPGSANPVVPAVGTGSFGITGAGPRKAWAVTVRRTSTNWPTGCTLAVRRTSSGVGTGTVVGGTSPVAITAADTALCTGTGQLSSIGLELTLTGFDSALWAGSFSTSVTYTVGNTP